MGTGGSVFLQYVLSILGIVGAAAGVYAAIRADLAALHVHAQNALAKADKAQEDAEFAHRRIEDHVERFHARI